MPSFSPADAARTASRSLPPWTMTRPCSSRRIGAYPGGEPRGVSTGALSISGTHRCSITAPTPAPAGAARRLCETITETDSRVIWKADVVVHCGHSARTICSAPAASTQSGPRCHSARTARSASDAFETGARRHDVERQAHARTLKARVLEELTAMDIAPDVAMALALTLRSAVVWTINRSFRWPASSSTCRGSTMSAAVSAAGSWRWSVDGRRQDHDHCQACRALVHAARERGFAWSAPTLSNRRRDQLTTTRGCSAPRFTREQRHGIGPACLERSNRRS